MEKAELVEEKQLQVRFTTKLALEIVNTPFSVPSHLTRYGLSEVINAMLGLENPQPFDFLVDGELLRTSLEQFLLNRKLSVETILNIECLQAVAPPTQEEPRLHDDWVSAVDGSCSSLIFTGSYDSLVRIWSRGGQYTHVLEGHKDAITSLSVTGLSAPRDKDLLLVSASKDRTVRVWQLSQSGLSEFSNDAVSIKRPVKVLKGHTSSVQSVAVSPSGDEVCSGSWDCSLKLWQVCGNSEMEEQSVTNKRRKLDSTEGSVEKQEIQVEARATLGGHTQCVSAVAWSVRDVIHSASWDRSIRSWDIETGVNVATVTCSKALHCLSIGGDGCALLAAGGADHVLRIWDPRMPGIVTPMLQLLSHKGWITACKWHQQSRHHIMSASHDGSVKLWDIRSKVPLHTVETHRDKVLCADWCGEDSIVSGGADCLLQVISKIQISL